MSARPTAPSVLVEIDVPMQLEDGTILMANVYRPAGDGTYPVLLTRTPYDKGSAFLSMVLDPVVAAQRGYIVVIQDVRGTGASGGEQDMATEFGDGSHAVAWAAALPGSSGRVGMFGDSYGGFTQLAAAAGDVPQIGALVPQKRGADVLNGGMFRQGAFELGLQATWHLAFSGFTQIFRMHGDDPGRLMQAISSLAAEIDGLRTSGFAERPLRDFGPVQRHDVLPAFTTAVRHPMDRAAMTSTMGLDDRIDEVSAPSLHVGGWFDIFQQQTLDDYVAMRRNDVPATLLMGPWTHLFNMNPVGEVDFGVGSQDASIDLTESLPDLHLRWYDHWLKDIDTGMADAEPVKVFVMGENRWRSLPTWPPASTPHEWYLHGGGRLAPLEPSADDPADRFVYDPDDPVPTRGGNIAITGGFTGGPADQTSIEARADVLTYTSEPLVDAVTVIGRVRMILHAVTSAADTDFVVRLSDVHPDGRSMNVVDGIVRALYREGHEPVALTSGTAHEYSIDLWSTAHTFAAGHRLRVAVTSSSFPRWDANPNTGTPFESAQGVVAHQDVLHDAVHASRLVLPVVTDQRGE